MGIDITGRPEFHEVTGVIRVTGGTPKNKWKWIAGLDSELRKLRNRMIEERERHWDVENTSHQPVDVGPDNGPTQ